MLLNDCCKAHVANIIERLLWSHKDKIVTRSTVPLYDAIIGKNPIEQGLEHMNNEGLCLKDHFHDKLLSAIIANDIELQFELYDELSDSTKLLLNEGAARPIRLYCGQNYKYFSQCPFRRALKGFVQDFKITADEEGIILFSCVMKHMKNFFDEISVGGCFHPFWEQNDTSLLEAVLMISEEEIEDLGDGRIFKNSFIDSDSLIINSHFEELITARIEDDDYEDDDEDYDEDDDD